MTREYSEGLDAPGRAGELAVAPVEATIDRPRGRTSPAEGVGERSLSGTLAGLLALTSDAVVAFDGAGRVLLANDEARDLLGRGVASLTGVDVRALFPAPINVQADEAFSVASLPFGLDGAATRLVCLGSDGRSHELMVRAERVSAPGDTYLLVATPVAGDEVAAREHERLVEELSRANRRLSGTLEIVLSTIDSSDVGTLFSRVLEEICQTMDASGTLLYLVENGRLNLRGSSESLEGRRLPRHLSFDQALIRDAREEGGSLRLRLMEPTRESLRQGRMSTRVLLNEETHETRSIPARYVLPFSSMIVTPVWFGGYVIAMIVIGWESARQQSRDDVRLLNAVGRYLSTQLAGALSMLRQQRTTELADAGSRLRQAMIDRDYDEVRQLLSEALAAEVVLVRANAHQPQTVVANLPHAGACDLPLTFEQIIDGRGPIVSVGEGMPLGDWLADEGEPCVGAFVEIGLVGEELQALLLLRDGEEDPFDDLELTFLRRFQDDARDALRSDEVRNRDRRIAQALQSGMRNELQKVNGITAKGIYSSATQSAFVGGDFYDLIRLPDQRACVIMGDVSGKGVEAASVSAAVRTALGAYSWEGLPPARMVSLLNEFLLGFSRLETFATVFVGIIDGRAKTLTYCSAGHPPALLARAQSGELLTCDIQSGVVGAFADMVYRNGSVALAEGDVLLLYTDGTTEARSSDGSFFGDDGLRDAVMAELPLGFEGLLDRLLARLDDYTGRRLEDDVAMVGLRFDALG